MKLITALCFALLPLSASAAETKTFIACPVYRDTDAGRKSGCWLAADRSSGVRYDVTQAPVKPYVGREILVEGVVSDKDAGLCGGVTLEPVRVSVLDSECKAHEIPAEEFPGRRFVLPARTLQPAVIPRRLPPPPYDNRQFTVYFSLNDDFLIYQHAETIIEEAMLYIKASKPQRVVVTGFADTKGFNVSGRQMKESLKIGEARARMINIALTRLGIPPELITLEWKAGPQPDELARAGLPQASKRRATIWIQLAIQPAK